MQDIIRAIIKDPGEKAREKTMINSLKELQYEVGGLFKVLRLGCIGGILMIINKERNLKELGLNFPLGNGFIVGTAVFVGEEAGEESGDLRGLTEAEIQIVHRIIEGDERYKDLDSLVDGK